MDFTTDYQQLKDEELFQLWVERNQLTEEARAALKNEIQRRGKTKEAESAKDVWTELDVKERKLSPPPTTFFDATVLWFWGRESWLRRTTAGGVLVDAEVVSTKRTRTGYRSATARVELIYSYRYEECQYLGRTVRDFVFGGRTADALAFNHIVGDKIVVTVSRTNPSRSYFPSGFLVWQSALSGVISLFNFCIGLIVVGAFAFALATAVARRFTSIVDDI